MVEGYEKLKIVGKGSFGTATLCKRLQDDKLVVMKEILTIDMDNTQKLSAFNEVNIISTLSHPNIIKYLGNFQNNDSLIIIMEYADGGNLGQLINAKKNNNDVFTERGILTIILEICGAIAYMHLKKIIHRDLKTANIFLTQDGTIKVGDFGISKMLNTRSQAQTVVGTPYYLSPEICEGYKYNEKSDVWAIGCILYELACLKRPFEAPTLPLLVQKITACQYENIPNMYSKDTQNVIRAILQKNVADRPSALSLEKSIIPHILAKIKKNEYLNSTISSNSIPRERSILYKITEFDFPKIEVIDIPPKNILHLSSSTTHTIIVTSDHLVYAYGNNSYGQLGYSNTDDNHRNQPVCINYLNDKHIVSAEAGNGFSLFLSYYGYVFSCGDGSQGCLGNSDLNSCMTPTIINILTTVKIKHISCGFYHAAAVSREGKLFTWGTSITGALGQGYRERCLKPMTVTLPIKIKVVCCYKDATVIQSWSDEFYACGNNMYCKLGISNETNVTTFQKINLEQANIRQMCVGEEHSIVLLENGDILRIGLNEEHQFGKLNKNSSNIQVIPFNKKIKMISCDRFFSTAVDVENVMWLWGTTKYTNEEKSNKNIIFKNPTSILALYSSKANLINGYSLYIFNVRAIRNSVLVVINTTVPPCLKYTEDVNSSSHNFVSKTTTTHHVEIELPNTPQCS
ncbi:serine/threonine-protein kinase Nek8 isoform X2 [Aethina tumida]|uniref:serine/threonine-protein kinase Nek8 isoform X2 n=1 Tax=Aethina tumida TaxID=116153 RepID=UPI0021484985|nr:serine/threonine-protein kinase Nek8 isoform X2 [Aethina tumida]